MNVSKVNETVLTFFGSHIDTMSTNSMKAQSIFQWWMVLTECYFILSAVGTFCQVTLSIAWQNAHTALNFRKKTYDTLFPRYLWTLHSIMRLDMMSNHGRDSPQRSINSEISISIIKHVQKIITIICMCCVWVATELITFTSTEDSTC